MKGLLHDFRYALRSLANHPGFALLAALTLALGIGANGAIFSLGNAILLRPIAAPNPEELVRVYEASADTPRRDVHSYPDYLDYRDQNQTLAGLAAQSVEGTVMSTAGQSEQLLAGVVSGNYFDVMGLRPHAGRFFRADEDHPGAGRVIVLGHRFWQRRFGGKSDVIGRTLVLNNEGFTVVGIAPKEFPADFASLFLDLWVPVRQASRWIGTGWQQDRDAARMKLIGRRKAGVSTAQAQADLGAIGERLAAAYPQEKKGERVIVEDARFLDGGLRGPLMGFVALMLAMAGLVLLTACANLANFFLVRTAARRREMAVRTALGAGRGRLIRHVYAETMCVALLGGVLGSVVAAWLAELLSNFRPFPPSIPIAIDATPDYRVYLYTLGLSLVAGAFLGIAPSRQAIRSGILAALKEESGGVVGGTGRARGLFVVAQVALSLVLLIGAGLFLRSLRNAGKMEIGFEPSRVLSMDIDAGLKGWNEERVAQYYRDVVRRVGALPGVQSVTLANLMPLDFATRRFGVVIEGYDPQAGREPLQVSFNRIGTRYFETLQIPLVSGRDFRETDAAGAPGVVIINQTMAARFWPGKDPLGQRFQLAPGKGGGTDTMAGGKWLQVVGVARDAKYRSLGEASEPHMYLPYAQNFSPQRSLILLAAANPGSMIAAVQNELRLVDSDLLGFFARTGEQHLVLAYLPARVAAVLSTTFGGLALALATLGLYGVVAWSVAQRTREIGVRMALGASRGDVLRLIIGRGMGLVAGGIVAGLAGAFALSRFLSALLYGVSATDPVIFAGLSLFLAGLAAVASYIPARRATRLDPVRALRYD